ncbi:MULTISPECIES: malonate--CoA ligase [Halomonas]|uniref:Malonyl-CoA synthase n=1 Tax=Halomonas halophila TaxID=29573 RepID=A0ABQ0U5K4_9GAMM|nr:MULTISPECIES: malonyl-CoA synthase [Halomonas]MDR5890843.1 malonyl-CoA synthase [Halomonas salina]WJY06481.1 malonyl-CoA synthase [Halomonas halophila]GEK73808.1 malonyl-CoA synthase [Halomonas halophila]
MHHHNLFLQFEAHFRQTPDKTLIDTPDGRRYAYGEVLETSRRLAGVLQSLDVQSGDRVAVQVDKSPEAIMLYLACLQAGAVYLPLNTGYTGAEIAYFLGDAAPQLYVCPPARASDANRFYQEGLVVHVESLGTAGDGSLMERAADAEPMTEIACLEADDLAAILYTSGTTGRSKGAMLSHANLASNSRALAEAWRFTADDHLLHALPIFHTHGLFVACNIVLTVGASMTFLPRLDVEQLLDLMPRATVLMGVPTFYTRLLQSPRLDREAVANMRLFVSGSAPLLAETHDQFRERTGHVILERYGMTETNMNTSNPYDGERRPGTVGFPLPGSEVRITDRDSGAELPRGETGRVEVRGDNVFRGYWQMPEKTRSEFRDDGFFITGDLGRIDADGYLHIVGRDKDLVISGGYNVYPKEVEQLIDELPGVAESAVFGVGHPDLGEGVTAVIVAREGEVAPDEAAVQAALADRLARYKQPKRVFTIEALPRNVMGKVQKNQLRDAYADLYAVKEVAATAG